MEIPNPTEQDKAYFFNLLLVDPLVEVKPVFGNLGAFVNGNMFMGLFGPDVGVKLAGTDHAALFEMGAGPFGPERHKMARYLSLPAAWRAQPARAEDWVTKALAGAASLPPKMRAAKAKAGAEGTATTGSAIKE